ncbi:Ribosome biogenesis protein 1 [Cichlidogyrus casuarinus]|uniref:Ribosome biogenesis protein 1 n=1 Tax=Cichlidogyrus casuarinus TaxID=1844966 RepID=A0ABD2PRF4_9PLAT
MNEVVSTKKDEYDFDSSDEEDVRNTVGNIPLKWYEDLAHLGYDTSGRPLMKPNVYMDKSDAIDNFLATADSSHAGSDARWRTVIDPQTGQAVVLTDGDLNIVTKMAKGKGVLAQGEEPYPEWKEFISSNMELMPISAAPPSKRTFIPSISDKRLVSRMVHAMKMGHMKCNLPSWTVHDLDNQEDLNRYSAYETSGNQGAIDSDDEGDVLGLGNALLASQVFPDVWDDSAKNDYADDPWRQTLPPSLRGERPKRHNPYLRPAQEALPGHSASYNPPEEFLLTQQEKDKLFETWKEQKSEGLVNKSMPLFPKKYDCIRRVPFSLHYLNDRAARVRDLVMATRFVKAMVDTTPEAMLPKIPSLSELRPYPSKLGIVYKGHAGRVTSVDLSPCGNWLASACPADGTVRVWEVATNYCFRVYPLVIPASNTCSSERPLALVRWNPTPRLHLLAAAFGKRVFIINPALGDRVVVKQTSQFLLDSWTNSQSEAKPLQPRRKTHLPTTQVSVHTSDAPVQVSWWRDSGERKPQVSARRRPTPGYLDWRGAKETPGVVFHSQKAFQCFSTNQVISPITYQLVF